MGKSFLLRLLLLGLLYSSIHLAGAVDVSKRKRTVSSRQHTKKQHHHDNKEDTTSVTVHVVSKPTSEKDADASYQNFFPEPKDAEEVTEVTSPLIVGDEKNDEDERINRDLIEKSNQNNRKFQRRKKMQEDIERANELIAKNKFLDDNIFSHSRAADRALHAYKLLEGQKVHVVQDYNVLMGQIQKEAHKHPEAYQDLPPTLSADGITPEILHMQKDLEHQLAAEEKNLARVESSLKEQTKLKENVEAAIEDLKSGVSSRDDEIARLKKDLEKMTQNSREAQKSVKRLRGAVEKLEGSIDIVRGKKAELEASLKKLMAEAKKSQKANGSYKIKYEEKEAEIEAIRESLEKLNNLEDEKAKKVEHLKDAVKRIKEKIASDTSREEVGVLQKQVDVARAKMSGIREAIATAKREGRTFMEQYKDVDEARDLVKTLKEKLSGAIAEAGTLKKFTNEISENKNVAEKRANAAEDEMSTMKSLVESYKEMMETTKETLKEMGSKGTAADANSETQSKMNDLQTQMKEMFGGMKDAVLGAIKEGAENTEDGPTMESIQTALDTHKEEILKAVEGNAAAVAPTAEEAGPTGAAEEAATGAAGEAATGAAEDAVTGAAEDAATGAAGEAATGAAEEAATGAAEEAATGAAGEAATGAEGAEGGEEAPAEEGEEAPAEGAEGGEEAPAEGAEGGEEAPAEGAEGAEGGEEAPAEDAEGGEEAPAEGAEGGEEAPAEGAEGGEEAPAEGAEGGEEAPAEGAEGGEEAPAEGEEAPAEGGEEAPAEGGEEAPAEGGEEASAEGGEEAPAEAAEGGEEAPAEDAGAEARFKRSSSTRTRRQKASESEIIARAKAERDRLCVRFPSATIDVKRYAGLNQGQDGACTLVALIHLFWLSGAEHLLSSSKSSLQRSWRTFWKPPNEDFDASPDIASTIDMSLSTGLLPSAAGLNYVPIRSEGNREQSFNESFWTSDTSTLMERYDVSSSSGDYEKIPYVYQNANLVESLLDEGHPIAINALEHSRVAVAYNDTHLLFADSWGPRHYETNKRGTDVTSAGFSVVDKWLIYSWMRDLAYVDDANAPEAVEAAQQMKRRRRSKRSRSVVEVVDLVGSEKVKMKNKPRRVRQRTSITRTRAKESECVDLVARDDDVDDDDGEMVKEKGRADASTRAGSSKWKEQQQRAEVTDDGEVFSWIARDNFRDELSSDDSEWEP
eukprot:g4265.t1